MAQFDLQVMNLEDAYRWQKAPDSQGWWWFKGQCEELHLDPDPEKKAICLYVRATVKPSDPTLRIELSVDVDGAILPATGGGSPFYGYWQRVRPYQGNTPTQEEIHEEFERARRLLGKEEGGSDE